MDEEKVLEVVPVNWKKSMFKSEPWVLVVTNQRMLFAKWTKELFDKAAQEREAETKEAGGGRFKQMISHASTGLTYYNKYLTMPPDEVLKETPENFALTTADVKSVTMKKGRSANRGTALIKINVGVGQAEALESPNQIIIDANTGKMVFEFSTSFDKAKEALSKIVNVR